MQFFLRDGAKKLQNSFSLLLNVVLDRDHDQIGDKCYRNNYIQRQQNYGSNIIDLVGRCEICKSLNILDDGLKLIIILVIIN